MSLQGYVTAPVKFVNWMMLPGSLVKIGELIAWAAATGVRQMGRLVDMMMARFIPELDSAVSNCIAFVNPYVCWFNAYFDVAVVVRIASSLVVASVIFHILKWAASMLSAKIAGALLQAFGKTVQGAFL